MTADSTQLAMFKIMRVIHPDIIGITWDGVENFEIICPSGETMEAMEFVSSSITRNIMLGIEDYLSNSKTKIGEFEYRTEEST